jgi:hypothetical protein
MCMGNLTQLCIEKLKASRNFILFHYYSLHTRTKIFCKKSVRTVYARVGFIVHTLFKCFLSFFF